MVWGLGSDSQSSQTLNTRTLQVHFNSILIPIYFQVLHAVVWVLYSFHVADLTGGTFT